MSTALRIDPAHMTDNDWGVVHDYFDAARESGEVVELSSHVVTLSPAQFAKRLNISRSTVIRRIEDGTIGAFKTGAHYRIPENEAELFRQNRVARLIAATSDDIEADLRDAY